VPRERFFTGPVPLAGAGSGPLEDDRLPQNRRAEPESVIDPEEDRGDPDVTDLIEGQATCPDVFDEACPFEEVRAEHVLAFLVQDVALGHLVSVPTSPGFRNADSTLERYPRLVTKLSRHHGPDDVAREAALEAQAFRRWQLEVARMPPVSLKTLGQRRRWARTIAKQLLDEDAWVVRPPPDPAVLRARVAALAESRGLNLDEMLKHAARFFPETLTPCLEPMSESELTTAVDDELAFNSTNDIRCEVLREVGLAADGELEGAAGEGEEGHKETAREGEAAELLGLPVGADEVHDGAEEADQEGDEDREVHPATVACGAYDTIRAKVPK
jgi:hypothetical protein